MEYRSGISDFQQSAAQMFKCSITDKISILKSKIIENGNDIKKFIDVDIKILITFNENLFYGKLNNQFQENQKDIDSISQELTENIPR